MFALNLPSHTTTRLTLDDAPALQRLCERCGDYYEMEEGAPARPNAAEHLLTGLPPGKTPADKHMLAIHSAAGELVGVLDLIENYPAEGEWWLGLLLLDPQARTAGLGSRILSAVKEAVAAEGGTAIYLGVLEHNAPAERFWRRHGFAELRRQPYIAASGHESRVIVMRHALT
ncbi:MAG TPA: GNAT family N-acetyltransferase [Longimicrobium sp.]|nr:GNAT family N-acetyltransferase [Longimicrobium sp.]